MVKPTRKIIRPGGRIRVLVVDDSVVIRRLVAHALEEDPTFEVVGAAANGAIALAKIPQVNPDAITLDIEMPEMDGLETLRRIRQDFPDLCVIMLSAVTARGASATLDALALGANDYVTKAANVDSLDRSIATLRSELIPKIKQFFWFPDQIPGPPAAAPPVAAVPRIQPAAPRFGALRRPRVIAVGVSTGGPTALSALIRQFPPGFPLPVLIVQHMPPLFTRFLAERLQTLTGLRVEEGAQGSAVEPGKILIAPGNYHMRLAKNGQRVMLAVDQGPPENSCRPSVDVLFRSVQETYGGSAIAVILTGMGQDGLLGTEALKASGAYVIAQDEASSVVWGMPGAVAKAGLADAVVGLESVMGEILTQI